MIREALGYCFEDGKWLKNGLIGSGLIIASILIIPAFTLLGYLLRVMRENSLPEYENFIEMTKEGVKASLIPLTYVAIPFAIAFTAGSGTIAWIAVIFEIIGLYALFSALHAFANGGMKDAFSKEPLKNAFTLNYLKGIVGVIVVQSAIGIAWILSLILVIPIILLPTVYYYQYLTGFRIMTEAIETN